MIELTTKPKRRVADSYGQGHYGAPRGSRTHKGIDFVCHPGTRVCAPVSGKITKLGVCYPDDHSYRYVQITDSEGYRHRLFYVQPSVEVGDMVAKGAVLGEVQTLGDRYRGITEHCHYEIKDKMGDYIDPDEFWS
jgi:murein DD-endopeptidase MepM/ murein hydrolase activator NlpD